MSDETKSVTKKARGFLGEFKAFISRGNVIDMAVGVIIATAFGKITTSLVNDVVMPAIQYFIGSADTSSLDIVLQPAVLDESGAVISEAITIGIGTFIGTIIDFILVALVVFLVIKAMNAAKDKAEALAHRKKEEEAAAEEPPAPLQGRAPAHRNPRPAAGAEQTVRRAAMEPEERKDEAPSQEESTSTPEKKPYKPYSRKARMWAWIGIAFYDLPDHYVCLFLCFRLYF